MRSGGDRESGSQSDEDAETSDYVEGIVPYINSVLAELISEALLGKPIDGRFGKNLRGDVQELIRNIGNWNYQSVCFHDNSMPVKSQ